MNTDSPQFEWQRGSEKIPFDFTRAFLQQNNIFIAQRGNIYISLLALWWEVVVKDESSAYLFHLSIIRVFVCRPSPKWTVWFLAWQVNNTKTVPLLQSSNSFHMSGWWGLPSPRVHRTQEMLACAPRFTFSCFFPFFHLCFHLPALSWHKVAPTALGRIRKCIQLLPSLTFLSALLLPARTRSPQNGPAAVVDGARQRWEKQGSSFGNETRPRNTRSAM